MRLSLNLVLALVLLVSWASGLSAADFLLKDGERVLFLGNTFVEREQEYGEWELQLTLAAGDRKIIFRNLGWSGDTVWTESRGLFDPPAAGYQRTLELVRELKPTTIILGYGAVESERGSAGLEAFKAQYKKLRSDLSSTKARFMHLSPLLMEAASFPVDSEGVAEHVAGVNKNLNLYAEAIRTISAESGELFIDFREAQRSKGDQTNWMENGVHLSQAGYQATAAVLVNALGGKVDKRKHKALKGLIQRKNELFFYRWRPQNFTYLLGFRKHEQGNNAVEIAQFDPLITDLETEIQKLKTE